MVETIASILKKKASAIHSVSPDAAVYDADGECSACTYLAFGGRVMKKQETAWITVLVLLTFAPPCRPKIIPNR